MVQWQEHVFFPLEEMFINPKAEAAALPGVGSHTGHVSSTTPLLKTFLSTSL